MRCRLWVQENRQHLVVNLLLLRNLPHSIHSGEYLKAQCTRKKEVHLKEILWKGGMRISIEISLRAGVAEEMAEKRHTHELAVWPKNVERPSFEMELANSSFPPTEFGIETIRTGSPENQWCLRSRASVPPAVRPVALVPADALFSKVLR